MPESKELNQVMLRSLSTLKPTVLGEESKNEPIDLPIYLTNWKRKENTYFLVEGALF